MKADKLGGDSLLPFIGGISETSCARLRTFYELFIHSLCLSLSNQMRGQRDESGSCPEW
jgi:hypothetical protein